MMRSRVISEQLVAHRPTFYYFQIMIQILEHTGFECSVAINDWLKWRGIDFVTRLADCLQQ